MAAKIKIIKRNERTAPEAAAGETAAPKKSAQETARDMVATVSGWVNDFQQRRRGETAQAIKTLFADVRPGEA